MKKLLFLPVFCLFLLVIQSIQAQRYNNESPFLPLNPNWSPLFSKDIVINSQPTQDQRTVAICSAFNGWLFSVNAYVQEEGNMPAFTIMKSVDNGLTWTVFFDLVFSNPGGRFTTLYIVTTGNTLSNLKVIIAGQSTPDGADIGVNVVYRINGETGVFEKRLLNVPDSYDIALSTDNNYLVNPSTPSSIGVLCSTYSINKDSLFFWSSSDGGMTMDNKRIVAVTGKRFHNVALSYGRSSTWNSGRYLAVWEEKTAFTSATGHIYTAHTEPDFTGPFTLPVMLDGLDPSALNKSRNPKVACQYNNIDNDSSNLTEVVLFEKYLPASNRFDIEGFYNKKSANTDHFNQFTLNSTTDDQQEPSLSFNPFDSKFMVTFYDTTTKKLPFLLNDFNMITPNNWQIVTSGYNDSTDLIAPFPKVALSIGQQQGAMVWVKEGTGGNGVAMFDAPYSTGSGISAASDPNGNLIGAYPNPCTQTISISFELKKTEIVTINLMSILGQYKGTITNQSYTRGKNTVHYNVSNIPTGTYLYSFRSGDYMTTGKFSILR